MKKIFLSFWLCVIMAQFSNAQDSLKVARKQWTTELNINPFKGELSLNALNQIKFRYFGASNTALRLGLSMNSRNFVEESKNAYGYYPINSKIEKKTRTIGASLGFESHLKGTSRLSPYFGTEFSLTSKKSTESVKGTRYSKKIDGAWERGTNPDEYEERGYFSYGVNLIGGFDFYIAKHLYLGYELTFGLSKIIYKEIDVNIKNGSTPVSSDNTDTKQTEFFLGAKLLNGIRLGYAF